MRRSVLDSYALLPFLRDESGAMPVRRLLESASGGNITLHMTEVNYAEVKYMTLRKDGARQWARVASQLPGLPIEFHSASRKLADLPADLKSKNRISLADAFAAALAGELGGE